MIGRNAIGRSRKTVGMIHLTTYTMRKAKDDPTLVLEDLIGSYKFGMIIFFGAYIGNGCYSWLRTGDGHAKTKTPSHTPLNHLAKCIVPSRS